MEITEEELEKIINERLKEIAALPVTYDNDIPEFSDSDLKGFAPAHPEYFKLSENSMKMKKLILLAPDRATKDFPSGKGVSTIIPSCVNIDRMNHEVFKADFNFICHVCSYIKEHGNKEDKKWIENLIWDKLIPVYKNNNVDNELVEHLIAQVTDCAAFKIDDR